MDRTDENLFRSIGRLEGKVDAISEGLTELKASIKESRTFKWQAYSALITSIVAAVSSAAMLFHFGIK